MGGEIWLVRAAHNAALPLGPSGALSRVACVALTWGAMGPALRDTAFAALAPRRERPARYRTRLIPTWHGRVNYLYDEGTL